MNGEWRGLAAQELSVGPLRAVMVPGLGGKIVSLRFQDRVELLANDHLGADLPAVDAAFVDEPMGGWDECMPTIDACVGPVGLPVPDHGEAWRLAWNDLGDGWFGYAGRSAPYDFARRLIAVDGRLRLQYRVRSRHDRAMGLLWAAHPQFAASPGTRVLLGPHPVDVVDVLADPPVTRAYGPGGLGIDDVPSAPGAGCMKWYVAPDQWLDRATVLRPDGIGVTMSWDADVTPYLGLWFDRAALARQPVVAVEPTTGYYDSAERAATNGRLAGLPPGGTLDWHVDVEVAG